MSKKVLRQIIQDQPSDKDLFHGGGHERTAFSLSKAIVKFDKDDSAIGLDGSWGSGKSSVVEMAARILAGKNGRGKKTYHFFTFDIWKSQGSGFRRSFLEHFITWSMQTFPRKIASLEEIKGQIQGKTREIETNNHPILDWYGIAVLCFLPFLPIFYFWSKSVFDQLSEAGKAVEFLYSAPFLSLIFFVLGTLGFAFWKQRFSSKGENNTDFKTTISRMLLISSRQHQDHKVVQKVREIDPNDYEFHATLRAILSVVQSEKDRVIMVLDNIDRLPQKEIRDYWALVRSVFARTHDNSRSNSNTDITAIVPYDRKLIEGNIIENDTEHELNNSQDRKPLSGLGSRELFSKTFGEILVVAPPVLSNARDFFADKLNQALPNQVSADDTFRTYRIFCELLNVEGGTTTPRQIVSFVNDLSGLYALHDGKFRLPTVAAFIAHQDSLTENPAVLNSENGLNQKIARLAADDRLVRNLAAIVFNVEEDLAFQILLDDEIANAAVAKTADTLVKLSAAPGFELRVEDAVEANMDEWRSTEELGKVIENFSALFEIYSGDARKHIVQALINGFKKLSEISLHSTEQYDPYLLLLKIVPDEERPAVVEHLMNAAFVYINRKETLNFQHGKDLASFIGTTNDVLEELRDADELRTEVGKKTPSSAPDFMFGLAANIAASGFSLDDFASVEVNFSKESEKYEDKVVQSPSLAVKALVQFQTVDLLTDDEWLSIADACLEAMKAGEVGAEKAEHFLEIVSMAWGTVDDQRRLEIALDSALASGEFFRNVEEGQTTSSQRAQASLLFLLKDKLGKTLADPTNPNSNGSLVPDTSNSFQSFKVIFEGNKPLDVDQVGAVASKAIDARCATLWIKFSNKNRGHEPVRQIVLNMFSRNDPPYITLRTLLSNFSYISEILVSDDLRDSLGRYAERFDKTQIEELKITDLPSGFLKSTHACTNGSWKTLHDHVDQLLKSVSAESWPEHIEKMDHTVAILIEKIESSGCALNSGDFRNPFTKVVIDIFAGNIQIENNDKSLDTLMNAIGVSYHEDIWRTLREQISGVTSSSLQASMNLFPELVENIAQSGDRILKTEKDNVIRNLLIPALEGHNKQALQIFVDMGFTKLKDFQNAAETSSTNMLEGAWKDFKSTEDDRDLIRAVSEAIHGKRKTKSSFDPSFWLGTRG
ncbi:MAG: hypothetical protein HWE23_01080 [Rhodobacteraceae bacterium]|nr:hypothetical protein [Paracoccaceae bacterium]